MRGNTTKEFFDMLGNNSAVVTGCPSMFQMGRNLKISNEKVDRETFKASLNGSFNLPISRQDFQKCDFIDQDRYIEMLFRPNYLASHPINFRTVLSDVAYRGYVYSQSLADRRIKAFLDTQQWMRYFEVEDIDFSFGSRIHGTIMPILSGVPSMIVPCDARTREMAEFFDIPMYDSKSQKNCDLYELYCQTDYTKFNENFTSRYDAFEDFLVDHNIVDRINPSNIYMQKNNASTIMPPNVNNDYFMAYAQCFNKNRFFLYSADTVVTLLLAVTFITKHRLLYYIAGNARNLFALACTVKLVRLVHLTQGLALYCFQKFIDLQLREFPILSYCHCCCFSSR